MTGTAAPGDPFPSERFAALLGRLPKYARLAWRLARDDRLPRSRQAALIAGAAYLVSPIDLVPGIIPVAGQLDDAVAVLVAIRLALAGLPAADREATLARAGLDHGAIDEDLRTIGATYTWLGRQGARITWRATRVAVRAGSRVGARLGRSLAARVRRHP
jgi:uncharacterized membrane protein YkvA (DUF1232 family)